MLCPFLAKSQAAANHTAKKALKTLYHSSMMNPTAAALAGCPYMRMLHSSSPPPTQAMVSPAFASTAKAATTEAHTHAHTIEIHQHLQHQARHPVYSQNQNQNHNHHQQQQQQNHTQNQTSEAAKKPPTKSAEVAAGYDKRFNEIIKEIKDEGRYRIFADIERQTSTFPLAKRHLDKHSNATQDVTIWCSNDYLGMGQSKVVIDAMKEALTKTGAGAGGTRNISGNSIYHVRLERELSSLHHKDASLLFTSGYVANETALETLASALPNCIVFSDEKNHASMIAGIRNYSKGKKNSKYVFRHNDVNHLRELLQKADPAAPKIIAFESVYSMDGAISPIKEICDVADEFNAITYLDEVHAVGMYGAHGAGVAERDHVMDRVTVIQGTLGKAFGLMGGYISSSNALIDVIRSKGSGFIFTTSLPPHMCAGAVASIGYLKNSSMERELQKQRVIELKKRLLEHRIPILPSVSHIIPILVGESNLCSRASQMLLQHGIYIQPINYPTVPVGTERLRITPGPRHTAEMMDHLVEVICKVWKTLEIPFASDELLEKQKSLPDPRC